MKRCYNLALVVMALSLLLANLCRAALIFDNGNHVVLGKLSSGLIHLADDFTLSTATAISEVHWKGVYNPGSAFVDDFSLRIYANSGFKPTTPIVSSAIYTAAVGAPNRTPTGEFILGFTVYEYSATISPFVAQAGTRYWLELFNNADAWYWARDPDIGNGASTEASDSWHPIGGAYTFQLFSVPEPSNIVTWSMLMLWVGCTGRRHPWTRTVNYVRRVRQDQAKALQVPV